jgi:hypothetical protein
MKKILILLLSFPLLGIAQPSAKSKPDPCAKRFTQKIDKFKKTKSKFLTNPITVSSSAGNLILDVCELGSGARVISLMFYSGIHCITENSDVEFLFADDFTLTFQNRDDTNCKGNLSVVFIGDNECTKFARDKVVSIRFQTTDGSVTIDLTKNQAQKLFDAFYCLIG